jgi:hypothetical protein
MMKESHLQEEMGLSRDKRDKRYPDGILKTPSPILFS